MKKVAGCLLCLVLIAYGFRYKNLTAKNHNGLHSLQYLQNNPWVIPEQQALAMIDYYKSCKGKCHHHLKDKVHTDVTDSIEAAERVIGKQIIPARYTDDDAIRYRQARHISDADPSGAVSGYDTYIVKYTIGIKGKGAGDDMISYLYVDAYTICPPPDSPPCN